MSAKWHRRAEDRPTELYEAALEVFTELGYSAARLDDVAKRAGVSKGLIYRYFSSKEDLLTKALMNRIIMLNESFESAIQMDQGSVSENLRKLILFLWERFHDQKGGSLSRLLMGEIAKELPDITRLWAEQGLGKRYQIIADVLKQGQDSGEFRKDFDPMETARFLLSGITFSIVLQKHKGLEKILPWNEELHIQNILNLLMNSITTKGESCNSNP